MSHLKTAFFVPSPAHIDVVPAFADKWSVEDPFSGELRSENGATYIYGRGAIDDKGSLMAILEALEFRLAAGKGDSNFKLKVPFGDNTSPQ